MKVRILHCVETIGSGGVEQRRLSISRNLDRRYYEQMLTCSKVIGEFDRRLINAGTTVERLGVMGSPFNFRYYRNLLRVVRRFRPHIIHGAVFEGVLSAVVGGIFCRIPIIIIEETSEPVNRSWRGHLLFWIMSQFADAVVAISPAVYDYLINKLNLPPSKTHLIMNGVEVNDEPEKSVVDDCRASIGLRIDEFVIGSVGRMLDDTKLFSVLILAFEKFAKSNTGTRLVLVGDGIDKTKLEKLVEGLGLGNRVVFVGHQTDVQPFYRIMHVFALVSAHEGFGMAAVEAMFSGLPVIATNVGGLKEIVVDHETGLLVAPNNANELSKAMEYLYSHQGEAQAMGSAGHQRAQDRYSAKRYIDDLNILYRSLIKSKLKDKS